MDIYLAILDDKAINILRDDYTWELVLRKVSLKQRSSILNVKNEIDRMSKALNMLIFDYIRQKRHPDIEVQIGRGEYGKPLDLANNCAFNISDEDRIVSLAMNLGNQQIGMDLAKPGDIIGFGIRPERFINEDFKDIFTETERGHLMSRINDCNSEAEKFRLLSQHWALKESYCKYLGIGITSGLDQFEFNHPINEQIVLLYEGDSDEDFVQLAHIELQKLENYDPWNAVLSIGNTGILASVFSHSNQATVYQVNIEKMVRYFTG